MPPRWSSRAAAKRWRAGSRSCPPRSRTGIPGRSTGRRRARRSSRRARAGCSTRRLRALPQRPATGGHGARRLGRHVRDPLPARRPPAARSLDRGARRSREERGATAFAGGPGARRLQHVHRPHLAPAATPRHEAMDRARAGGGAAQADINLRMFVGSLAALTVMWTGLYLRAAQLIEALRAMSVGPGVTPFSLITLKNIETMYAMFIADGGACARAMREGLDIAQATGVHTWTFQLLVWGYGGALGAATSARRRRSRSSSSRSPARPGASTFASTAISRPGKRCCART